MKDIYATLKSTGEAEFEEKKSRFIGCAAPVSTEEEALAFIKEVKNKYKKALDHEKRRNRSFIMTFMKWAFILILFFIVVSFFNIIGLIISVLAIIGYIGACREEKKYWNDVTNNGAINLKDVEMKLLEMKKSLN